MKYTPKPLAPKRVAEVRRLLETRQKKAKTSVSLSGELIHALDAIAGQAERSGLVERAVRRYLRLLLRRARHEHDLRLIDARADATNRESNELLRLQVWPE
jgi:metal-responsive CopG/Arc/MetJ family transcriptional regulator